jgi:hypothetical protein
MKLVPCRHEKPRPQATDVGHTVEIRKVNDLTICSGQPMRECHPVSVSVGVSKFFIINESSML